MALAYGSDLPKPSGTPLGGDRDTKQLTTIASRAPIASSKMKIKCEASNLVS